MSLDRERSRDSERERERETLKHQHSFDRHGRSVPMWDSADPDRAPPPLPLNPSSSPQLTTRPNTSANIAARAQALIPESAAPSPYTTNPMPDRSPEKSLIKGAAHRRMQSLQTNSVRDLRSYLDGSRSPERSPERSTARATTPTRGRDLERDIFSSPAPSPARASTPTPSARSDALKDAPSLRPSSRPPPKAILGENTPPSATMLALQTMPGRDFHDPPLSNITNGATGRKQEEFGGISTQILSLTTICTNLQREMMQLSRRSKDNATDLVSLKEATSTRDEDIRKSLRELVHSVNTNINNTAASLFSGSLPRDNIFRHSEHSTPPPGAKSTSFPRMPSPSSLFDDRIGSTSPYSVEGVASVAMLEKIIREMVTKDGQEQILATLSSLFDKASKDSGETAKKVDEMRQMLKNSPVSSALVPSNQGQSGRAAQLQPNSTSGPLAKTTRDMQSACMPGGANSSAEGQPSFSSPKAADFVSDEMIKLLKKIKESVTNSGGMIGEVKAQQRDLRGEVLHMGRDIARKIDDSRQPASGARQIEDGSGKQDIARIVQEGLADLKQHLDNAMREKRRSSSSTVMSRSSVNSQEVYDVVKHSFNQQGLDRRPEFANAALDKEAILQAVKEAYEEYKPEVTVEQFGLERDEILQCLKDGFDQHRASKPENPSMSRQEMMEAIQEAMQNFHPPPPINEANEIRDEVLLAVRECLDSFKPPVAMTDSIRDTNRDLDLIRQVILDAIRAGMVANGPNAAREIEISREDLFEAVKAGLESSGSPFGRYGEMVVGQLNAMVQEIRAEFKDYSTANGRDTEQVLDAMKDGLELLRVDIEQYVDRAQDVTSKDEIIDTVRGGLEHLRLDVETYCAAGPQGDNALSRTEMIGYIKSEFGLLHDAINGQALHSSSSEDKSAILGAIHDGFQVLKADVSSRGLNDSEENHLSEAMTVEFEQLREAVIGGSSVHKDELVEVITSGFDTLHGKIDGGAFAGGSSDEMIHSVKDELEHLRQTLASTMAQTGGLDSNDAIREALDDMRAHLIAEQNEASKESIGTIQTEFEHLRNTITSALVTAGGSSVHGDRAESIQLSLDELREQLTGDNGVNSKEVLNAVQSEFATLRESLEGSLVVGRSTSDKDEILEAFRSTLDAVKEISKPPTDGIDDDLLGAIRGEFGMLQTHVSQGFSRSTQRADTEDILDAMRLGFDDLRSELVKKIENPERHMKATDELLDVLNEGMESLKEEINKKPATGVPIDMTVSYEILDTLKEGITSLRTDVEKIKSSTHVAPSVDRSISPGNEVILAEEATEAHTSRSVPAELTTPDPVQALHRNDLEKVEIMLAQLQIKIDALDANISDPAFRAQGQTDTQDAEGTASKDELVSLENLIRELQRTVDVIASREIDTEIVAKKEDTDAIETLLVNTKSKIDEMNFQSLADHATKQQIEALEVLVVSTRGAIDDLTARADVKVATKEDITIIEVMVHDLKTAMDEFIASKPAESEIIEQLTKQDLDVLGVMSVEIKEKLEELESRNTDERPSKADIEKLTGLIHDFRESHDKLKSNYEDDIAITAKAFDDRKKEAEETITAIGIARSTMLEVKEELKSRIDEGALDVTSLADDFKILERTIESNFNVTADIKELMEIANREFERLHGAVEDVKMNHEQKSAATNEKNDEARQLAVAEICTKLDERFDSIMSKYDDAQQSAEAHATGLAEKSVEQEAILATTKEVAEDLRVSVDTLGMAITSMETKFNDIAEKVAEDSQTVYNKMEEGFGKLDDVFTLAAAREEHQLTRSEVARAADAINSVQGEFSEYHPIFMVKLQEVHALLTQHHEQSREAEEAAVKAQKAAQEQVQAVAEQAQAANDHSRSISDKIESSFSALPALLPPPPIAVVEPIEKYDDAQVHEKLDKLMAHVAETKEASVQLERLDKIHQQVMATAAEVSEFVSSQTHLITEGYEEKQKEAEEMALLLERRAAEKEHLDNDVQSLTTDKDHLLAVIEELKSERDGLAAQKARLGADVTALQTALSIRHEEMDAMEAKADALERRILDGIMDQSRLLMMKNGNDRDPLSSERNVNNSPHGNLSPLAKPSAASQGLTLALKSRLSPARRNGGSTVNGNRRVLSLNPITPNTPNGAQGYLAANTPLSQSGFMKRSQSVRTNGRRNLSWNSAPTKQRSISTSTVAEDDKENDGGLSDIDQSEDEQHDEGGSEAGLVRLVNCSETGMSDATGKNSAHEMSVPGHHHSSQPTTVGTESSRSYETGSSSYMTGSDLTDRRSSYGSTVRSTLGVNTVIDEDESEENSEDDDDAEHDEDAETTAGAEEVGEGILVTDYANFDGTDLDKAKKEMVVYAAPSDSGLGTDLPTAGAMSGSETDYFRRAAEDAANVI